VTVNSTIPQRSVQLTDTELQMLRGDGTGTSMVNVTVSENADSGTIFVGVENTQEIIADTGGN